MKRASAIVVALCGVAYADGAPSAESIRAARDAVYAEGRFRYAAPKGKSFVEEFMEAVGAWLDRHPTFATWAFVGLAAVLVAILVHLVWTLRVAREARWTPGAGDADALARGDASAFRAQAIAEAASGRFDEAVRNLYAALLIVLERRGAVSFASSKALLDYRMEAARDADALRTLDFFADSYHPGSFGRRPPDRARFDHLLDALDRLAGART